MEQSPLSLLAGAFFYVALAAGLLGQYLLRLWPGHPQGRSRNPNLFLLGLIFTVLAPLLLILIYQNRNLPIDLNPRYLPALGIQYFVAFLGYWGSRLFRDQFSPRKHVLFVVLVLQGILISSGLLWAAKPWQSAAWQFPAYGLPALAPLGCLVLFLREWYMLRMRFMWQIDKNPSSCMVTLEMQGVNWLLQPLSIRLPLLLGCLALMLGLQAVMILGAGFHPAGIAGLWWE